MVSRRLRCGHEGDIEFRMSSENRWFTIAEPTDVLPGEAEAAGEAPSLKLA